jgi:glutamyl/glutaminyl-tRNA synthetase
MAKKSKSAFHYRVEDTDQARSTLEFEENLRESLEWLSITSELPTVRQSSQEEAGVYKDIVDAMVKAGVAYYCQCSTMALKKLKAQQIAMRKPLGYEGACAVSGHTSGVVRLNISAVRMFLEPNEFGGGKDLRFTDSVYGPRHVDIRDLRDVVLLRADGTATYLLANTADDFLTGVTDIVRGADLLPQTAIQILLRRVMAKVLKMPIVDPRYTHLPLVLSESGEKLSKRDPKTLSILDLRDQGFLPTAILQFILGVGNNSISKDKAMSLEEIVQAFDPSMNAKNNVAFSFHQLLHINKLHIRKMPAALIAPEYPEALVDVCKTRFKTLVDVREDIAKSYRIKTVHHDSLASLASLGFPESACKTFRANNIGEPSMALEVLWELQV